MDTRLKTLLIALCCMALAACEPYNCTLGNVTAMYTTFYQNNTKVTVNDTLTVTACGSDSILYNRAVNRSQLTLPLSYWQSEDTLVLNYKGKDYLCRDTIWIAKTNQTHFESPECPVAFFHTITAVRSTHIFIDTITITRPNVDYGTTENLQIHLLADTGN